MVLPNGDWLWNREWSVPQVKPGYKMEETGPDLWNGNLLSRIIRTWVCNPFFFFIGPVTCNSTHMTIAIPAFPGTLAAVGVEDQNVPMDQLQTNRIALDTKRGIKLHINKRILKSKVSSIPTRKHLTQQAPDNSGLANILKCKAWRVWDGPGT